MHQTIAPIAELLRMPAPCPQPWGLACDGNDLWIGSIETNRIYGVRALQGTVFEEAEAPGMPMGITVTGDALRVVMSEGDDGDRYIRRYIMGKHFKSERIDCPDLTGSFLAYDGDRLFLSQRYAQRILELDEAGAIQREIAVPRQVTGMVIVGGRFYVITTVDRESDDYRLLCIDARKDTPEVHELATLPFTARSLGYDGTKFWTAIPASNELVAFAKPD